MVIHFDPHSHRALLHNHEHFHITHHAKEGEVLAIEHLAAIHAHMHNHIGIDHSHGAHLDEEREHMHEGHIHDHSDPTEGL